MTNSLEIIAWYLFIMLVMLVYAAWREPDAPLLPALLICMVWPISMPVIVFGLIVSHVGFQFNIVVARNMFGFKFVNDSGLVGFSVTMFWMAIQVWKVKK